MSQARPLHLALLILCIAVAGFAQSSMTEAQSMANPSNSTITLVDPGKIYNTKTPTDWVGISVQLQNVQVQDTNDTGNFWVGSDGDHRLLVVKKSSDPNLNAMKLNKGDIVSVVGVIQPASNYMAEKTSASEGSMKDAGKSSGVFFLANNVSVTSSTRH